MEKAVSNLCNLFINYQIIKTEEKEVYEYCFAVLAMNVFYFLICILVMCYYQCFLLPFIFTVVYMLLRSYIGGWHASTMWGCLLFGLLLFIVVINILLYPALTGQEKLLFSFGCMLFAGWTVNKFGVQDHPNRKLSEKEKVKAKNKFFYLFHFSILIMILTVFLQQIDLTFSIALAYFMAAVFLLLAEIHKKGVMSHEKK